MKSAKLKPSKVYKEFGYYSNYLNSFEFEGASGFRKMNELMENFRNNLKAFGNFKIVDVIDYSLGINGLPKSNVLKMILEDGSYVIVRPSGTEPKLKAYVSILGKSAQENDRKNKELTASIKELMK